MIKSNPIRDEIAVTGTWSEMGQGVLRNIKGTSSIVHIRGKSSSGKDLVKKKGRYELGRAERPSWVRVRNCI